MEFDGGVGGEQDGDGGIRLTPEELATVAAELASANPMARLAAVAVIRGALDDIEEEAVRAARADGVIWPAIAERLDRTKQSVHRQYATRHSAARQRRGLRADSMAARQIEGRRRRAEAEAMAQEYFEYVRDRDGPEDRPPD